MGSGCNNFNVDSGGVNVSDTKVVYTGPAIPNLGICTGDKLSEIEAVILEKLQENITGTNITLDTLNVDQCDLIKQFIQVSNVDKSLVNVLDVVIKAICSLSSSVKDLDDKVDTSVTDIVYNLGCLTVSNPNLQNVINAIIAKLCSDSAKIEELYDAINNINNDTTINNTIRTIAIEQIIKSIKACYPGNGGIVKSGSGTDTTLTIVGLVPPYCPIFSVAGPENFDNTGKGKPERGFCGWYICNGLNGTPDLRGFTLAGATQITGIGGPVLHESVRTYPSNVWDRKGQNEVRLTVNQMPSHTHEVIDPGHVHGYDSMTNSGHPAGSNTTALRDYQWKQTEREKTGITLGHSGGGAPHENRQPTFYGMWIMRK